MQPISRVRSLWRNLLQKDRVERDLDDELEAYVDLSDEERAKGRARESARRAARLQIGGIEQVKERVRDKRTGAGLETLWLIAIALAAVGVYGVVSYTAASRRREIGIRLALGARAAHVLRTVLGRVAVASGAGLVMGTALTLFASAAAASFLYGVEPRDPTLTLLIVGGILVCAVVAAALPARRALRTDPVVALKYE